MRPPAPATPKSPSPSGWRWAYPLALAGMIVVASGQSHVAGPQGLSLDKVAHFTIFGLLATLVARCPGVRRFRYAILAVSLFGITDEFRQSFTPGRSVEFADWVADTTGALTAVSLYVFWPRYRRLLETPLRLRRPAATSESPSAATPAKPAPAA